LQHVFQNCDEEVVKSDTFYFLKVVCVHAGETKSLCLTLKLPLHFLANTQLSRMFLCKICACV